VVVVDVLPSGVLLEQDASSVTGWPPVQVTTALPDASVAMVANVAPPAFFSVPEPVATDSDIEKQTPLAFL
jgi:hypothetical protein